MARPAELPQVLTEEEADWLLSKPNQRYFGSGEDMLEELQAWMDRRKATASKADDLLLTSKGTQVATSHLRRSVKRYARDPGIEEVEHVSPHVLRHTFATRLYRETSNIRDGAEGPRALRSLDDDDLHARRR